jgi:hypothetical protein
MDFFRPFSSRDSQKLMHSPIISNPEAKPLDCGSEAAAFSGNTNDKRRQLGCRNPRRPCGRFYLPTLFISHTLFNPALPVAPLTPGYYLIAPAGACIKT